MRAVRFAAILVLAARIGSGQSVSDDPPGLDPTSMDLRVDPCTDFYTYACGGWMAKNPIPPDKASWSVAEKLQEKNRVLLRGLLEAAARPDAKRTPAEQKIGDYYAACMDETAIESRGRAPFDALSSQIGSLASPDDLAGFLASFHAAAPQDDPPAYPLFAFASMQDFGNSADVIAQLDQGGLGLPDRDFYLKTDPKSLETLHAYEDHVRKMFALLGETAESASEKAKIVLRIETALAQGSLTSVERRDPQELNHKMGVAELKRLCPTFGWDVYLKGVGRESLESLNVTAPEFFKALDGVLRGEKLESLKVYLLWHAVRSHAGYLPAAFVEERFNFYGRTLTGAKEPPPRWSRCVDRVDRDLGEALGQAFVAKAFSPELRRRTVSMVKAIELAMEREIRDLGWMSEKTKTEALQKLGSIRNKIGYPEPWRDYSSLDIVRGDFFKDAEDSARFEFRRQLAKIGRPLDRGEWQMTPPTVNAYYDAQMNDMNFPAGILQPPLFDPRMDDAPNYGDTGGTIGHELTHGFDDEGRQFDADGNLRDWWTLGDAKEFERRALCVQDQYSRYTVVPGVTINSKLTLGEDVADLGGLLLAYRAWKDQNGGKKLPSGNGLTPEQRFFVGYGQSWCSNSREEDLRLRAATDPHSPPRYRANGVVANMPEFRAAFACPAKAAMVREPVCKVW